MNQDNSITWAILMMMQGHKVRHANFTSEEYLHMVNGVVMSEDGYDFDRWMIVNRKDEEWKLTGWRVHNE